jgi:HSP20 family protein
VTVLKLTSVSAAGPIVPGVSSRRLAGREQFLCRGERERTMRLTRREKQTREAPAPLYELNRVRSEINRLFEEPFGYESGSGFFEGWQPAVDVVEDRDNVIVRAELPGMKQEEISVSLDGNILMISGERKQEEESDGVETFRAERYFGRFQRILMLPHPVDPKDVRATYKDGVLSITLPKSEAARPHQIEVRTS